MAGVYSGAVSVKSLLTHGDFGLGTFANLDGEMVVLDGRVYQVKGSGQVFEASETAEAPFAVLTRFAPEVDQGVDAIADFDDLKSIVTLCGVQGTFFTPSAWMERSEVFVRGPSVRQRKECDWSMLPRLKASSILPMSLER